jgi:hypothetical protein
MGRESYMIIRRSDKEPSNAGKERENTIRIISDAKLDPTLAPGITIRKMEIEFSRRPRNLSLKKLLRLKHTRPIDQGQGQDQYTK